MVLFLSQPTSHSLPIHQSFHCHPSPNFHSFTHSFTLYHPCILWLISQPFTNSLHVHLPFYPSILSPLVIHWLFSTFASISPLINQPFTIHSLHPHPSFNCLIHQPTTDTHSSSTPPFSQPSAIQAPIQTSSILSSWFSQPLTYPFTYSSIPPSAHPSANPSPIHYIFTHTCILSSIRQIFIHSLHVHPPFHSHLSASQSSIHCIFIHPFILSVSQSFIHSHLHPSIQPLIH